MSQEKQFTEFRNIMVPSPWGSHSPTRIRVLRLLDPEDEGTTDPLKHWELWTCPQHCVTWQKTWIFTNTTIRTSNLKLKRLFLTLCMFIRWPPNSKDELISFLCSYKYSITSIHVSTRVDSVSYWFEEQRLTFPLV